MKQFHPNEVTNVTELTGEVDDIVLRRSAIKLSDGPRIMVAIPIGGKSVTSVLECPKCEVKYDVDDGFRPQGLVPVAFMLQQMNWMLPLNTTVGYVHKSGVLSAQARQIMTQACLDMPSVKYIFYVDDDMIVPPEGLARLYDVMENDASVGVVSGVYVSRTDPPELLVYTAHGEGAARDMELGDGAALTEIMGAGAGCLLVRTDAIRDWQKANPGVPIWSDARELTGSITVWGHDVRFVRNLREAGWKCYADGRVMCGHYDIMSGKVHTLPANFPGLRKRAVNTSTYWDAQYTSEGMKSWRTYEAMFGAIEKIVADSATRHVGELGCGSGVLGQRLTARLNVTWAGIDLSEVAVTQACAKYLYAQTGDVRDLGVMDLVALTDNDTLVATEFLEHMSWEDTHALLEKLNVTRMQRIVFATPFKTMHPDVVPEHEVFVDDEYVAAVKDVLARYKMVSFDVVDEQGHAVWVFERR